MNADQQLPGQFAGQVALVTGGTRGIGRGVALRLASQGADVAVTYFRDGKSADRTVAELRDLGVQACARRAFFGDPYGRVPASVMEWVSKELGPPGYLVSNAGTGVQRPLREIKRSHWDWAVETHAASFLKLVQHGPDLKSVVAISSLGSQFVMPNVYGVLAAAKAAMESIVRYLAVELAPHCRVNAVTPGLVDTKAARDFEGNEVMFSTALSRTPAGRLVQPEDVGALVSFLLSSEASMLTGQTLVLDGGYSILM